MSPKLVKELRSKLIAWYQLNARELPWRSSKNPYSIWISEIMLQQTTVTAVIPFFKNFLKVFPTVHVLANSDEKLVLKNWAGLGYYSRARNLHKAAQTISKKGFPNTWKELIELPGLGEYTSRSIASLAFSENVGVLDGNVIRVLSRVTGTPFQWWKTNERKQLQILVDELAQDCDSSLLNQGLMELGSTLCTPKSPTCLLCPWSKQCQAFTHRTAHTLPLAKPKKQNEYWTWTPQIIVKNQKIYLEENNYAPFLKGALLPPGTAKKVSSKPTKYDFAHSITHHKIYIRLSTGKINKNGMGSWTDLSKISEVNPTSLMKKTIDRFNAKNS